jgi:pimeloyl-ACP methyl ester carboxylesterase
MSHQFIHVNGLRLAYREWPGERGPLICLPHLTGHKGSFNQLAQRLAPEYRVLALDLRGRGDSDKPAEGYGFAYHARDVLAFADALDLETFTLIGHSFGATTAVYLTSVRPERVQAIVMLDGGADPKELALKAMYPTIHRLGHAYPSLADYLAAQRAAPYFRPWSASLEAYFTEDAEARPDGAVWSKSSAEAIAHDMDLHFLYCLCLHFPNMHRPALFVRPALGLLGEKSHVFSELEAAAIVRNIPNCRRVDVPEVNHYTMLIHDDPPVVEPVREFLDEVLPPLPAGEGAEVRKSRE